MTERLIWSDLILIPLDSHLRRRILVSLYGLEYIFALDYIVPPKMFLHHLSKSVVGIDLNSASVGTDWNWLCLSPKSRGMELSPSVYFQVSLWLSRTLSYLESMGLRRLKNSLSKGKSCGGNLSYWRLTSTVQISTKATFHLLPAVWRIAYIAPQKGSVSLSLV